MDDSIATAAGRPGLGREDAAAGPAWPAALPVIPLGWRFRLGVLMPSVNTVAEPQLAAMLPPGVSMHCTRLKLTGSSEEELVGMTKGLEEASRLLADAEPQRILFHCTAVTTIDDTIAGRIREQITAASGIPATVTSEALVAAFRALSARRIVMVTPYIQPVNDREVAFLAHHGIEVVQEYGFGLPNGRDFAKIEAAEWYRVMLEHRDPRADAYFLSCAQSRSAEIIEVLEHDLGRPVVTTNQGALWHCLRESGLDDRIGGFGRLLRMPGERGAR